mmetsp:Transcript_34557/g.115418  ORF Transcript_34557/g.115418 Transcript_34557/m.115418 type:complete len:89 (-) Transcript_34557:148-414(-)
MERWVKATLPMRSLLQAEAFISGCAAHFDRSLAGDQLNPVRTSYQCWCNFPKCFANEHIHRVVRRINELTGACSFVVINDEGLVAMST